MYNHAAEPQLTPQERATTGAPKISREAWYISATATHDPNTATHHLIDTQSNYRSTATTKTRTIRAAAAAMARACSMVLIVALLLAAVAVTPFVGAARDVADDADEGRDLSSADAPASGPDGASSPDSSEAPSSSSDA
jgi:hypothetical protein